MSPRDKKEFHTAEVSEDEDLTPDLVPTFSTLVGFKGRNRVRVYREREAGAISIEWWVDGVRKRKSLSETTGQPVYSKESAEELALELAAKLLKVERVEERTSVNRVLGIPDPHTVAELLAKLHKNKERRWKASTKRDSVRFRAFWELHLGTKDIREVTADIVMRIVAVEAEREVCDDDGNPVRRNGLPVKKKWKERTQQAYLRYIVDAFTFAQQKLNWITEVNNLSGVDFPHVQKGTGEEYTEDELAVLVPATRHPVIDIRCAGVAAIIDCTGRRLNSVVNLRVEDIKIMKVRLLTGETVDVMTVRFDPLFCKRGESGTVPVSKWAQDIIAELMNTPAVRATGLLFPSGRLDDSSPVNLIWKNHGKPRGPVSGKRLNEWLKEAEALVGVESKPFRAFHGLKRSLVTLGMDVMSREQIAELTGTDPATLAAIYRKETMRSKVEAMVKLEEARRVLRDRGEGG